MDKLKEMFERLPKWAKIGLPILAAVLVVYVIYKNKGSTSGTLTEAAVGSADTGSSDGLPATNPDDSTDPAVIPTPVTPSPKHNPQAASVAETKYAAHWAEQARKNAKADHVKAPALTKVTPKMTERQAQKAAIHNKGVAQGLAAKKGKK